VVQLAAATAFAGVLFLLVAFAYRSGLTRGIDQATIAFFAAIESSTLDTIGQADDELARVIPTFAVAGLMSAALAWKRRGWAWIVPFFIGAAAFVEFLAKVGIGQGLHPGFNGTEGHGEVDLVKVDLFQVQALQAGPQGS